MNATISRTNICCAQIPSAFQMNIRFSGLCIFSLAFDPWWVVAKYFHYSNLASSSSPLFFLQKESTFGCESDQTIRKTKLVVNCVACCVWCMPRDVTTMSVIYTRDLDRVVRGLFSSPSTHVASQVWCIAVKGCGDPSIVWPLSLSMHISSPSMVHIGDCIL